MKDIRRRFFCSCTGKKLELVHGEPFTGDPDEPVEPCCPQCGATPSSDPKHTISYRDEVPGRG